jgi:hypothetical protein
MLADPETRAAIQDLVAETYRRLSTPGSDPAALLSHPDFAVAGSGLGELAYDPPDIRAMADAVSSSAFTWSVEQVTVWREGDVAWAQILGSVRTSVGGAQEDVPYWTTGVFARDGDGWHWRYWGGAEPQEEPRV